MDHLKRFTDDLIEHTLKLDQADLFKKTFFLKDLVIEAFFLDENYADICEAHLALIEEPQKACPKITLYLLDAHTLGWPKPPRWFKDTFSRFEASESFKALNLFGAYLDQPRAWQIYDPKRRFGIQLIKDSKSMIPWESGGPLRHFLHWAYQAQDKILCHAGTLGVLNHGLLLIGPGGSGKSGTTLAGISQGLSTVGDDYCLLSYSDKVVAHALYKIIKQDEKGIARLTSLIDEAALPPLNWQHKYEIHASLFENSPFIESLEIHAIIILKIGHIKKCEIRPTTAIEAMKAWAFSSSFQLPDHEKESVSLIASLCKQLPCVELILSEDSEDIALNLKEIIKTYHVTD